MRLWKRFKEFHRRPELPGAGTLGEVAADHQEVVPPSQQVFGGRGDGGGVFGAEVDVADMGNPPHGGIIQASAEGQIGGKTVDGKLAAICRTGRTGGSGPITWAPCRPPRSSFALRSTGWWCARWPVVPSQSRFPR